MVFSVYITTLAPLVSVLFVISQLFRIMDLLMILLFGSIALATVAGLVMVARDPGLLRLGGFTLIIAGIGFGGWSVIPDTDSLPIWGNLLLIALGALVLWFASKREKKDQV